MAEKRSFFSDGGHKKYSLPKTRLKVPQLPTLEEHKAKKRKERAVEAIKNVSPEDREKLGLNLSKSEVKALVSRNEEFLKSKGIE